MPLPMPHDGEEHDAFMGRCMTAMENESGELKDAPHKQRVAVCMSQWRTKKMDELDVDLKEAERLYFNDPHFHGIIIKGDPGDHYILAPVLVPGEPDLQGDVISAEEIEKSAHIFLEEIREREEDTDLMHRIQVTNEDVAIVETYVVRADTEISGHKIVKGTWMLGMSIKDDTIWKMIQDGKLTGLSIFGVGQRTLVAES